VDCRCSRRARRHCPTPTPNANMPSVKNEPRLSAKANDKPAKPAKLVKPKRRKK